MCNCGNKRRAAKHVAANTATPIHAPLRSEHTPRLLNALPGRTVNFQYTGNTALSITGNITRKNYRFNFPGDIQAIDFNDASAMLGVPVLRKI